MQYTTADLWQAVYTFIPAFKEVRDAGVYMNLPSCLNSAIIEWSVLRYKSEHFYGELTFAHINASRVLHKAYDDLQTKGQFMPTDNSYNEI